MSLARTVLEQIIQDGEVTRGWLGIEPQEVTRGGRAGARARERGGVLIRGVVPRRPRRPRRHPARATSSLEIDGKATRDTPALLARIAELPPGSAVKVKVWRERKPQDVDVTVGRRPQAQ